MKYASLLIIFSFVVHACTEEISLETLQSDTAVIEAYLFANEPIDSVRIIKAISYYGDSTLVTLDDLDVRISDGTDEILLQSIGEGYYQNTDHVILEGATYSISFDYAGKTVSASTYVNESKSIEISQGTLALEKIEFSGPGSGVPGNLIGDQEIVEVSWDNAESSYYFVDVENIENNPEYVNGIFEFFEEEGVVPPQSFFRSEPGILDFYPLDSRRELQFYGTYEIIVYRLNAEYAALYESVGSSSLSLAEPPSNVENGLGIFTAVTPHVLYLEVVKE